MKNQKLKAMETKRDDSYMARYFDDLERELALVFEDIKDDGDRDDVVRQLQDYVMYQNSVLSMSPLACVKYYEASYHVYNFLRRTRQVQKKGVPMSEKIVQYLMALFGGAGARRNGGAGARGRGGTGG